MFGGNDPFEHMNSIMNNFFHDPFSQRNESGRNMNQQISTRNDPFGDPFSNFQNSIISHQRQNSFGLMEQMMGRNMNSFMSNMQNDPNAAVYSSSSVMTYSNTGDGQPKVYQASSQVRQAPGGVKETRQMLRDSEKGIEKVAVGHHIGKKAHVIERRKLNGGDMEEIINLENLDDDEIPNFNKEFEAKIRSNHGHYSRSQDHHHNRHLGGNQPFAIEGNSKKEKKQSKSKH